MGREPWDVTEDPSMTKHLKQAQREGRLSPLLAEELNTTTGEFHCPVCQMVHWKPEAARLCCYDLIGLDDCDTREAAIERLPPRAGDAFAAVLFPDELTGAVENLMDFHGCRTTAALANKTTISRTFLERALVGTVSWIGNRNWFLLNQEFEGDVPGCEKYPFE